jgi:FkbM family methyltransferase
MASPQSNSAFKNFRRRIRLWFYHLRHGPDFRYRGIRIVVPDDIPFVFKRLLMQGRYEESERKLVEKYLDPNLPVVELGGSIGVISALIGSRLEDGVPHRIVEANPAVVDICRQNATSARKPGSTTVVNAAIAYDVEEVTFHASANVHMSKVADGPEGNVSVTTTSLVEQVEAIGAKEGYTLVADIEGMEYEMFEREASALSGCRLAIVEIHPEAFEMAGKQVGDFCGLVRKAGFRHLETIDNTIAFEKS